jgi:uncharacterized membrane protein HdeD (DUF308 family)
MQNLLEGKWTTLFLRGILALTIGILLFLNLGAGAVAMLAVLGVFAILDGIFALWETYIHHKAGQSYGHTLLGAVVSIIIGVAIFAWPWASAVVLIALIAAKVLVQGGADVYAAFRERDALSRGRFWLLLIGGIAQLFFAIWMIFQPLLGGVTVIAVLAAYALVVGVILILRSLEMRFGGGGGGPMAFA